MANAYLTINGQDYGGWQSVRVVRPLEAISGSFELSVSERWTNTGKKWPIRQGDACEVGLVDSSGDSRPTKLLTGFIDTRTMAYSSGEHSVSVAGRDRTGLLVDSSVWPGPYEYRNVDVLKLAQKLCKPFGIAVTLQPGLTVAPVKKVAINPGETVAQAIEVLCRPAGLLPVSDGIGGLMLTRGGNELVSTALVEGQNILSAQAHFDHSGRFYRYVVLGSRAGSDWENGPSVAHIQGMAIDTGVARPVRVHVVHAEGDVDSGLASRRARWEATTRAARAARFTITVPGWEHQRGSFWPINKLVHLKSPNLEVNTDLLITQATFSLSPTGGTTTELELRRPDSFDPEPQAAPEDQTWEEIRGGALTVKAH